MLGKPTWGFVQMDRPHRQTHLCFIVQFTDNDDTLTGKGTLAEIDQGGNRSKQDTQTDYNVKSKKQEIQ